MHFPIHCDAELFVFFFSTCVISIYIIFLVKFLLKSFPHFKLSSLFYFLIYFIDYAITVVPFFSSLYYPPHSIPLPPALLTPPLSSCPWVILISSLASPFPILFLTSPCLFCTYHLCYLFSVPFPPLSSSPPADHPPCDLHFCGSVPVLVVCLLCFCIRLGS